jgi:hypothetical protein
MTLEAVCKDLAKQFQALHDQLVQDLLWTATETKPEDEHSLATRYIDGITDLVAEVKDALSICQALSVAPPNLAQASHGLMACQDQYNKIARRLSGDFLSYQAVAKLRRFGRERGGAWSDWAGQIRKALNRCCRPMDNLSQAIFHCWQEIADRIGMATISVQTHTIGQQITMARDRGEVGAADALT